MSDSNLDNTTRPEKPTPPDPQDCCGGGCVPCVYDYYYDALEKWQAAIDSEKQDNPSLTSLHVEHEKQS